MVSLLGDAEYQAWKIWARENKALEILRGLESAHFFDKFNLSSSYDSDWNERQKIRRNVRGLIEGMLDWPPPGYDKMHPGLQKILRKALFIGIARRG